jgi:hypothetical protein
MAWDNEPSTQPEAKELAQKILKEGELVFSKHAKIEMGKDGLDNSDALNVIRGGVVEPREFENGSWRWRFRTQNMGFTICFSSEQRITVVTGWRSRR